LSLKQRIYNAAPTHEYSYIYSVAMYAFLARIMNEHTVKRSLYFISETT